MSRVAAVARRAGLAVIVVLCLYLVVRALVEVGIIAVHGHVNPRDWGGPSTAGILAIHCLPGVLGAIVIAWMLRRRESGQRRDDQSSARLARLRGSR